MHGCKVAGRRQAPPLGALLPGDKCSMILKRDVRCQCPRLIMVPWLLPLQIHRHWPVRGSLSCIQDRPFDACFHSQSPDVMQWLLSRSC